MGTARWIASLKWLAQRYGFSEMRSPGTHHQSTRSTRLMVAQGGPFDALKACLYRARLDARGRPLTLFLLRFLRLFAAIQT